MTGLRHAAMNESRFQDTGKCATGVIFVSRQLMRPPPMDGERVGPKKDDNSNQLEEPWRKVKVAVDVVVASAFASED